MYQVLLIYSDNEIENIYDFDPITQKRLSKNKINGWHGMINCNIDVTHGVYY